MNTDEFYRAERTVIDVTPPSWRARLGAGLFAIGSCFAEHFHRFCDERFLPVNGNHFGPVYNPLSLAHSLRRLVANEYVRRDDVFLHRDLYRHFAFHSTAARASKQEFLREANSRIEAGHQALLRAELLVVTLGTAFVYRHRQSDEIVSNCHTLPANRFSRERLSVREAVDALGGALQVLRSTNPAVRVVLSVSPVRHLRDAPEENSLSKAILRCVAQELCENADCTYFPAFEIMLDELRDYRYYSDDLCHPSERAAAYVMGKMTAAFFDDRGRQYLEEVTKLIGMCAHRPRHPESREHSRFLERVAAERNRLAKRYPELLRLACADESG